MEISQRKEYFSDAYLQAVAAVAGFIANKWDQDLDKVDWTLARAGGNGTVASPRLDVQLKCTECDDGKGEIMSYSLDVETYDALRTANVSTPRILVVAVVPPSIGDWLTQTAEELAMRRCAYWCSLRGRPATENATSQTVHIPRKQLFTVDALTEMMERCAEGGTP